MQPGFNLSGKNQDRLLKREAYQRADVGLPASHDCLQAAALDPGVQPAGGTRLCLQCPLPVAAFPTDFPHSPDALSVERTIGCAAHERRLVKPYPMQIVVLP